MVLLHAAVTAVGATPLIVANYDHGTGTYSTEAARLVQETCARLSVCFHGGRAGNLVRTEGEWRNQRWQFLRETAARSGAVIATAHTLDDHLETVFMRILRSSGARGMAGLLAPSDILRPLLSLRRRAVERYAKKLRVAFLDDPSNTSRRHLRNRVRHDLMPALLAVQPTLRRDLLRVANKAADWRNRVDALACELRADQPETGVLRIARGALAGYDAEALAVLWPALAARINVIMDRRGTQRLSQFTIMGRVGGSIQVSGGVEVVMSDDHLLLRRWDASRVEISRRARVSRRDSQSLRMQSTH